jgi:hypothetical protein
MIDRVDQGSESEVLQVPGPRVKELALVDVNVIGTEQELLHLAPTLFDERCIQDAPAHNRAQRRREVSSAWMPRPALITHLRDLPLRNHGVARANDVVGHLSMRSHGWIHLDHIPLREHR